MDLKLVVCIVIFTLILSKTEARKNKRKNNGKYLKMSPEDKEAYVRFHNDVRARVSCMTSEICFV